MFDGANRLIFDNAKRLRMQMTDAENVLWLHLKEGVAGCKFRRQHPIGIYIADFYCYKAKLVVEVDESIHQLTEVAQNDEEKEQYLKGLGLQVIRFSNEEVMNSREQVIKIIFEQVNQTIQKQTPPSGV